MSSKALTLVLRGLGILVLCACTDPVASDHSAGTGGSLGTPSSAAGTGGGASTGTGGSIDPMSGSGGASGVNGAGGTNGSAGKAGTGGGSATQAGAGGTPASAGTGGEGDAGVRAPELAITADFLNKTLSIVDVSLLHEGGTRADALVGTVDLGMYSPGPMALGITPDGKTALVSISAGFLGAFISVPAGAGMLLFVDIETRTIIDELDVGNSPMGIVFSKDGKRAFVGLYSESYFAVVDVENHTYEPVSTGSSFNEELSIDDSGAVGILTYGPAGNAKTFSVASPADVLGQTTGLSGDAAGVAFFPGTKKAYLMQAPTLLTGNVGGHDVIDVTNPEMPVASDNIRMGAHPTTYPVTAIAARGSVAFPSTEGGMVSVVEMGLEGDVAHEVGRVVVGAAGNLAYGLTSTRDGRVLIAVPGDHYVGVVDLEAGTAFTVPWEVTMSGPTEIKVVP